MVAAPAVGGGEEEDTMELKKYVKSRLPGGFPAQKIISTGGVNAPSLVSSSRKAPRELSGMSKDVQGELWSHGPTRGESRQNGAQRSSIESPQVDRLSLRDRSTHLHTTSSIDPMQANQLDRSRSVSAVDQPVRLSRSIRPTQMISQPFDLLGANRLDRTVANRIEPKLDPELFRPIFSHCLGYAVFQSFSLFLREKRSNLCFHSLEKISVFDSMTFISVIVCCFAMSE
ncbi:unnamed protein product [Microthlaspi erraticum]|uniref:Uncharacterized protein n=1 Tax=Microthlaspi erraticum TaxID=1685480 RepID=A0A6D2KQ11_9BRAS|nr:unnamed protein product [Microthlaspi erraticum]